MLEKHFLLLPMLKTVVLLNTLEETVFINFFMKSKLKKNSIYLQ